jgi:hypothetical protein
VECLRCAVLDYLGVAPRFERQAAPKSEKLYAGGENMEDNNGPPETYKAQIARRRTQDSPFALPYWQRIGVGLVVLILLMVFGGLAVGFFDHIP